MNRPRRQKKGTPALDVQDEPTTIPAAAGDDTVTVHDQVAAVVAAAPARSINDRDVEADPPTEHRDMAEGHGHAVTQSSADAIAAACAASGFPAPELRIREEEA